MGTTNFGWFDNQVSGRRELWCVGELRLSWPQNIIEGSAAFAPWGSYPDLPHALAERADFLARTTYHVEDGARA